MGKGKYSDLVARLRFMLEASGCDEADLKRIADDAAEVAIGVFRNPDSIIADGYGQRLSDATDLMLIGAIVARYGMVMGNPFAGKE